MRVIILHQGTFTAKREVLPDGDAAGGAGGRSSCRLVGGTRASGGMTSSRCSFPLSLALWALTVQKQLQPSSFAGNWALDGARWVLL